MHPSKSPVRVMQVEKCYYPKTTEHKMHRHDALHDLFHIMYCVAGSIAMHHNDDRYVMTKKSVSVCQPGDCHSYVPISKMGAHTLDIKVIVNDTALARAMTDLPKHFYCEHEQVAIDMEKMVKEAVQQETMYTDMIGALAYMTLIRLIRLGTNPTVTYAGTILEEIPDNDKNRALSDIVKYIKDHAGPTMRVSHLADIAGYSKDYFTKKFSIEMGVTPKQYIDKVTLNKAKTALLETNEPIGRICDLCGFSSIQYFSLFFKRHEQCSPLEFRTLNKKNLNMNLQRV